MSTWFWDRPIDLTAMVTVSTFFKHRQLCWLLSHALPMSAMGSLIKPGGAGFFRSRILHEKKNLGWQWILHSFSWAMYIALLTNIAAPCLASYPPAFRVSLRTSASRLHVCTYWMLLQAAKLSRWCRCNSSLNINMFGNGWTVERKWIRYSCTQWDQVLLRYSCTQWDRGGVLRKPASAVVESRAAQLLGSWWRQEQYLAISHSTA